MDRSHSAHAKQSIESLHNVVKSLAATAGVSGLLGKSDATSGRPLAANTATKGSLNALKRSPTDGSTGSVSFEGSLYQAQVQTHGQSLLTGNRKSPRVRISSRRSDIKRDNRADESQDISVDPTCLDPFLLALSESKFQLWVFFRELAVHVLQPLAFLYCVTAKGRILAHNRQFIGTTFMVFHQWFAFACLAASVLIYILKPPPHIGWEEFTLSLLLVFYRHCIIAFKYAFTSPIELNRMSEEVESEETRKQRQVLTGWILPSREVVETQVLLASTRLWLDLCNGQFLLKSTDLDSEHADTPKAKIVESSEMSGGSPSAANGSHVVNELQLRFAPYLDADKQSSASAPTPTVNDVHVNTTANEHGGSAGSSARKVSAWSVIVELILESHQHTASPWVFRLPPLAFCCFPLALRLYQGLPPAGGTHWTAIVYAISVFWNSYWTMSSNIGFVQVCVTDFCRRQHLFTRLKAILQDGFVRVPRSALLHGTDKSKDRAGHLNPLKEEAQDQGPIDSKQASNGNDQVANDSAMDPSSHLRQHDDNMVMVRLDMDSSHNLLMWWYTRLIIQDYGRPYLLRLQFYTAAFIVFASKVAIIMVIAFFNTLSMSASSDSGLLLCVYVMIILIATVTRCLVHGLWANSVREEHTSVLYKRGISLSTRGERLREISPKQSQQARDAAQLCWILSHASKEDEVVNALRVFGLPVSTRLATTFATVMVAGISTGLQLLVR